MTLDKSARGLDDLVATVYLSPFGSLRHLRSASGMRGYGRGTASNAARPESADHRAIIPDKADLYPRLEALPRGLGLDRASKGSRGRESEVRVGDRL